jgi:transcriptional regulator with XRE-family HTH domain
MSIGGRIRERRAALNLTQTELARRLETDAITVSRWERDNSIPRTDTLEKIARAIDVSIDWLVTGSEHVARTGTEG